MRRQGLVARQMRRRCGLTRQCKTAAKFPDLLKREFIATAPNVRRVGDMTEIPTAGGKLYLATVLDLYSRRLLGAATGAHPDADLACQAIKMAVAARGGADRVADVVFHTDRGSTYTAGAFTGLCRRVGDSPVEWAGWGHASTTPRPRRSSPGSSGKSCPGTSSPHPPGHARPSSTGATTSTTIDAA